MGCGVFLNPVSYFIDKECIFPIYLMCNDVGQITDNLSPDWRKERRMNKKLISLLLVIVMMLSLMPLGVLAAEDSPAEATTFNEVTGREPGPKGDEDVAVLIYGKAMSDAIAKKTGLVETFINTLKGSLSGILAGEKLPEVELYLVNDQDQEYKLSPESKPNNSAFLSSFRMETSGVLGWLDDVFGWLQKGLGWLISDVDTIGDFYKIYGAKNVPQGNYTLEIRKIYSDGYVLRQPYGGKVRVGVGDDNVNYVGYEEYLGGRDFEVDIDWWFIDIEIEIATIHFYLPGVYLDAKEPALEFTSADVGGNALPSTEFIMINRDETEKIVKAALKFGKAAFENAMAEIDSGNLTWEELNILNYDLLEMDREGQQINLDYNEAFKLLQTYWKLVAASAKDPWKDLMSKETDLRIPAMLSATADEKGIVRFTENSNVTLTWSVEILLQMAHLVGKEIQDIDEHDIAKLISDFEDHEILEAIVLLVIGEAKKLMVEGIEIWDDEGHALKDAVNDYLYPVLQRDDLLEYVEWADTIMRYIPFVDLSIPKEVYDVMEYLPKHGLLTSKMPAGHYVMMETKVPNGYFRNPLFYTMELTWNTENPLPDWYYCSVGNVGLIAPYFAEDYYKQLRDLNLNAEADKVLALINDNRSKELFGSDTPIQDIIEGDADMTARALEMLVSTVYQVSGKTDADPKEAAASMLPYFKSSGGTVQNLLKLCDKIVKTNKSVITDEITTDWKFYTPTTSIRTNAALRFKAFMQELSNAIVTDDKTITGKVNTAVKNTIDKIVNSVDTKNYTEPYVTAAETAVKEKVSSILSNVIKKATQTVKNTIGTIIKGDPLPIFSWKR